MLSLKEFKEQYICNNTYKDEEWELAKPFGEMKLKQRIKDAINVLLNKGVVIKWYG